MSLQSAIQEKILLFAILVCASIKAAILTVQSRDSNPGLLFLILGFQIEESVIPGSWRDNRFTGASEKNYWFSQQNQHLAN